MRRTGGKSVQADERGAANGHGNGPSTFLGACTKHFDVRAAGKCDDCGEIWCSQCLVPTTRKRQPTRCIDCALVAAGVRAPGARRAGVTNMSRNKKHSTKLF